jgi:hypothetical protein
MPHSRCCEAAAEQRDEVAPCTEHPTASCVFPKRCMTRGCACRSGSEAARVAVSVKE